MRDYFRYNNKHSRLPASLPAGQIGGTILITRGDALSKTETITFADVIAIAEIPRHTFIKKAFRRVVVFLRRARGFVLRRVSPRY